MNSQNTPVHMRLWHRDFWHMAVANLMLMTSVYMLVPTMPRWLVEVQDFSPADAALAMAAFGVGLFTFGLFVSYLVQRFRRNHVCIWSVISTRGSVSSWSCRSSFSNGSCLGLSSDWPRWCSPVP